MRNRGTAYPKIERCQHVKPQSKYVTAFAAMVVSSFIAAPYYDPCEFEVISLCTLQLNQLQLSQR